MIDNCYTNGYAISCLKNHGIATTWDACKEKCFASNAFKLIRPFWMIDFYNYGTTLNKTNFLSKKEAQKTSDRDGLQQSQFCTNLKYDFEDSKWTDIKRPVDATFIEKWTKRFGDFWNNYPNGNPVQPDEPAMGFFIFTRLPTYNEVYYLYVTYHMLFVN